MGIEKKVWGNTIELFRNNTTSTHYLEINSGGYCSEHKHAQKENIFYVIEGELEIVWWDDDGMEHRHWIAKENCFTIPVGVWHCFRALTSVKCIEIYDYKYDGIDIERRTQGGLGTN